MNTLVFVVASLAYAAQARRVQVPSEQVRGISQEEHETLPETIGAHSALNQFAEKQQPRPDQQDVLTELLVTRDPQVGWNIGGFVKGQQITTKRKKAVRVEIPSKEGTVEKVVDAERRGPFSGLPTWWKKSADVELPTDTVQDAEESVDGAEIEEPSAPDSEMSQEIEQETAETQSLAADTPPAEDETPSDELSNEENTAKEIEQDLAEALERMTVAEEDAAEEPSLDADTTDPSKDAAAPEEPKPDNEDSSQGQKFKITIDQLKSEVPKIFREEPNLDLLEEDFKVIDQLFWRRGDKVKGLTATKLLLKVLREVGDKFIVKEDIEIQMPDVEALTRRYFPRRLVETRWKVQLAGMKPLGLWLKPIDFDAAVVFHLTEQGKIGDVRIEEVLINGMMELQSWPDITLPVEEVDSLGATRDSLSQETQELTAQLDAIREVLSEATADRTNSNAENSATIKNAEHQIEIADQTIQALQPVQNNDAMAEFMEKPSFKDALELLVQRKSNCSNTIELTEEAESTAQLEFQKFADATKLSVAEKTTQKELAEQELLKTTNELKAMLKESVNLYPFKEWVEELRDAIAEAEQEEAAAAKAAAEREKAAKERREQRLAAEAKAEKERLAARALEEKELKAAALQAEKERRVAAKKEAWENRKSAAKKAVTRRITAMKRTWQRALAKAQAAREAAREEKQWQVAAIQAEKDGKLEFGNNEKQQMDTFTQREKERRMAFEKAEEERKAAFEKAQLERRASFEKRDEALKVKLAKDREEELAMAAEKENTRRQTALKRLNNWKAIRTQGGASSKTDEKEKVVTKEDEEEPIAEDKTLPLIVAEDAVKEGLEQAIDVLKLDIFKILHQDPHWELFAKDFKVIDETGAVVQGLEDNKQLVKVLHQVADNWVIKDDVHADLDDIEAFTRPIFPKRSFTAHGAVIFSPQGKVRSQGNGIDFDLDMLFHFDDDNKIDYVRVKNWLANGQALQSRPEVDLSQIPGENLQRIEAWATDLKDSV